MIRYEIGENSKLRSCAVLGDSATVCAEIALLLNLTYFAMRRMDEDAAKGFKSDMIRVLSDPGSAVWTHEGQGISMDGMLVTLKEGGGDGD